MRLLSKIIKSFRVVESNIVSDADADISVSNLDKQLLEEARERHEEIILNAKREAENIISNAYSESDDILNETYEKARSISEIAGEKGYDEGYQLGQEKGYEEGYQLGYKDGKEDAEKLIKEALDIKNEYIHKKNQLMREVENDLINLVISIYEKVLYKKVEEDKELIISLVLNGIDNLEISEKLTIIVSQDDYEIVNYYRDTILAKASLIDELDVRKNIDMEKGDCILETSKGSVDVSINQQLEEVKDLLKTILSNE